MIHLILLLVLLVIIILAYQAFERRQGDEADGRKETVLDRIDRQDVNLVEDKDRKPIIGYIIDQVIYDRGTEEATAERVGRSLRQLRDKASTTGVTTLDAQLQTVEGMADRMMYGYEMLENKARRFVSQKSVRYSTVSVFIDHLEKEVRPLRDGLPRLEQLVSEMDRAVDEIIRSQDQGLVSVEFGGASAASEGIRNQVEQSVQEVKKDLDITVRNIKEVFGEEEE